jgi:uncharacterized protein (TIGR00290 family)
VKPAVFCWSGGKDSALCLYKILEKKEFDVKFLLTSVNEQFRRISMHGVREELLDSQAIALGIPLIKIYVNEGTNVEYEKKMEETLLGLKAEGINDVIFGDIFLEDLRKYREDNLARVGMKGVFPLWKQDTKKLLSEFLTLKFKTVVCCTNDAYLGDEWAGRLIDHQYISELPENVDPCGENGEYHSFCFAGPIFNTPVSVFVGEKIYKPIVVKTTDDCDLPESSTKGFWFCELNPTATDVAL